MAKKKKNKKIFFTRRQVEFEFFKTVSGMLTAAFGLVAALAWNEAVKALIERYVTSGDGLRSKLIYALIVTALAFLVTYYMGALSKRLARESIKEQEKE